MLDAKGFKRPTYDEIFAEMQADARAKFGDSVNTSERSVLGLLLRLFAWFLSKAWQAVEDVYNSAFINTSTENNLDRLASNYGLTRNLSSWATGTIKLTGTPGHTEPAGFRVETPTGVVFETVEDITLDESGVGSGEIRALEAGTNGNVPAGTITVVTNPNANVTGCTNPEPTTGGRDKESDPVFRNRIEARIQNQGTSGNSADYLNWALEVEGVGKAKVFPLWDGPGTVKVVIIDSDYAPAPPELVQAVSDHIEQMRPIGAAVTVTSAVPLDINVSATVRISPGYTIDQVRESFREALRQLLAEIAFQTSFVSIARVGAALLTTPGVIDYSDLEINGSTTNVQLADEEIPVVGTITLGV